MRDSQTTTTFVLVNAHSGKKQGRARARELQQRLADDSDDCHLHVLGKTDDIQAIAKQAIADGYGTVVAAGGDGTISAVAEAVMDTPAALGVIPLGTFNYFARGLAIPETVDGALAVIRAGKTANVHVGEVNGRLFLNNASLGAYPAILDQREGIYRRWGRSRVAAYWSVLVALATFHKPLRMTITADGVQHRARSPLAFVAASAYQLEQFGVGGEQAIRDGKFALFVSPDCGRIGLLGQALKLAVGVMRPGRDITLIEAAEILIETSRSPRLLARDGEKERLDAPFRFSMRPDALRVCIPEQSLEPGSELGSEMAPE